MMVSDSQIDALERRMTTAESEIEGEKNVSRYAADQARRGTEAFLALRSEVAALRADIAGTTARVDSLGEDMSVVKAALVRHGRALDVLMQDVGLLRNEMATRQEAATLRQEAVALRQEMAALRGEMATRQEMAALREDMATRQEMAALREEMATRQEMAALREEMATRQEIAALREDMATRQEIAALRVEMATRHTEILAAIHALASDRPSM
jgi:hypothetical protein